MTLSRIKQLRKSLVSENISLLELIEIEAAFSLIPDKNLRDLRNNALASDMLDELENMCD